MQTLKGKFLDLIFATDIENCIISKPMSVELLDKSTIHHETEILYTIFDKSDNLIAKIDKIIE